MKSRDLTELALRNLREAILRNSLTTLGVAVGVASLVAMLSLGVGLQNLASQRLTRSGLFDAVFVSSPRNFGPGGGPGGPNRRNGPAASSTSPSKELKLIDDDTIAQIQKLPNVTEVYPQIRFMADIRFNNQTFTTSVLGIPESSRTGGAFDGMTGSFFSSPTAEEAILQTEFAKELSDQPNGLVGKDLTLRYAERSPQRTQEEQDEALLDAMSGASPKAISIATREKKVRIVGVTESDPSAGIGGFGGGRLFLPLKTAQQLHVAQPADLQAMISGDPSKPSYLALTVRAKSPKDVAKIEDAIKKLGFSAFSLLDATRGLRLVFTVFDLFLGLFGSLALTVASLGIINTLVMAILERRREIGVLKALGATDRDVRSLFFAEAGAMGLLGGICGVTLGWLIGLALTWGTTFYLKRQDLPGVKISYVPWWLAVGAIAFAVIVSLIAGLYPASRAAKLNPVEALRYE